MKKLRNSSLWTCLRIMDISRSYNNKRPRGLDACQQHCKISATDVSENVYLCSKMHYHALSLGVYPVVCIYILSMIEIYIYVSHHTFC